MQQEHHLNMALSKLTIDPLLKKFGTTVKEGYLFSDNSKLHDEQKEALMKIIKWFQEGSTKDLTSVVVMPTGTGKTGIICCMPYMLGWAVEKKLINHDLSKPILVIAPGLDIFLQLQSSLCFSPDHPEPFLKKVRIFTKEELKICYYKTYVVQNTSSIPNLEKTADEIVLSNAQKFRKNKDEDPNYIDLPKDMFSMVIVDEAHHLPADQWGKVLKKFKPAKFVFFTATPHRYDGREITTDMALSIKGYTYELKKEEAIAKKLIRDVQFTELDYQSLSPKIAVLQAIKDCLNEKNERFRLPGGKKHTAIVATRIIDEAEEAKTLCVNELKYTEKEVIVITSKNTRRERETILKDIQNGKYKIIIVVSMLIEGFDYPPLSVLGILTKIASPVKFAQLVGRIQRVVRVQKKETEDEEEKTDGGDTMIEVEDTIVGDIFSHTEYKQRQMFENYKNPKITKEYIEEEEMD